MPRLLVRGAKGRAVAAGVRCVVEVDGFTAQSRRQLLESGIFRAAQKDLTVHVPDNGVGVVLIQRLELGLRLQHQTSRDFPAADGGHQLFEVRDLADVGALVDEAPHMDGQPPAVYIIRLFTEQVEQLGVHHGNQEIKRGICVTHDEEQRCFSVAQGVQLQLVVGGDFPQFRDVEGGKASTAGNQNRLGGLARRQLIKTVLPHREVIGLLFCQVLEHKVYRVLKLLVILSHFHDVEKFQQGSEVLLLCRGLIVDIGNKRRKQELFCFIPEGITAFALAAGVGHEGRHQLQNVLF